MTEHYIFFYIKEKHKHLKAQYKYQSVKELIKKTKHMDRKCPINVTYSTINIQIKHINMKQEENKEI